MVYTEKDFIETSFSGIPIVTLKHANTTHVKRVLESILDVSSPEQVERFIKADEVYINPSARFMSDDVVSFFTGGSAFDISKPKPEDDIETAIMQGGLLGNAISNFSNKREISLANYNGGCPGGDLSTLVSIPHSIVEGVKEIDSNVHNIGLWSKLLRAQGDGNSFFDPSFLKLYDVLVSYEFNKKPQFHGKDYIYQSLIYRDNPNLLGSKFALIGKGGGGSNHESTIAMELGVPVGFLLGMNGYADIAPKEFYSLGASFIADNDPEKLVEKTYDLAMQQGDNWTDVPKINKKPRIQVKDPGYLREISDALNLPEKELFHPESESSIPEGLHIPPRGFSKIHVAGPNYEDLSPSELEIYNSIASQLSSELAEREIILLTDGKFDSFQFDVASQLRIKNPETLILSMHGHAGSSDLIRAPSNQRIDSPFISYDFADKPQDAQGKMNALYSAIPIICASDICLYVGGGKETKLKGALGFHEGKVLGSLKGVGGYSSVAQDTFSTMYDAGQRKPRIAFFEDRHVDSLVERALAEHEAVKPENKKHVLRFALYSHKGKDGQSSLVEATKYRRPSTEYIKRPDLGCRLLRINLDPSMESFNQTISNLVTGERFYAVNPRINDGEKGTILLSNPTKNHPVSEAIDFAIKVIDDTPGMIYHLQRAV